MAATTTATTATVTSGKALARPPPERRCGRPDGAGAGVSEAQTEEEEGRLTLSSRRELERECVVPYNQLYGVSRLAQRRCSSPRRTSFSHGGVDGERRSACTLAAAPCAPGIG